MTTAERMHAYHESAAQAAHTWYSPKGAWNIASTPADTRERFWICCSLYAVGTSALADAIIRKGDTKQKTVRGDIHFNIFDTNIAALLLVKYRDTMAHDVRTKLEDLVRDGFGLFPGNRQPDYQFHGYNDNMPAKATMGLILGGERLGNTAAVEHGIHNLRQLRAMLIRRGINSEFNSPTYTPLTVHAMAEIASHAESDEARSLALKIEHRLWYDIAARFHPETKMISGPYSRAYTVDTLGHLSCLASLLWFVLGDAASPSPLTLFGDHDGVLHHMNDVPFNCAQMSWFASGTYHLPENIDALFFKKCYPYRAIATAEVGDCSDIAGSAGYDAHPCRIETYMTRDFAVGTTDTQWLGGEQTMNYFADYRYTDTVNTWQDRGTVFTKFLINDDAPGNTASAGFANSGEADNIASHSNTLTIQDGSSVLLVTNPQPSLGSDRGKKEPTVISVLRELFIFPSHTHSADEVMIGGRSSASWSGSAAKGEWICVKRGRMFIGIRPLAFSIPERPISISLEKANSYEVIETLFYSGDKRTFSREELCHMHGGYFIEHACIDEYPSLAAFADACARIEFADFYWTTRRVRCRRSASPERKALEMEISISADALVPRFAAVNGRVIDTVTPLSIDGIDSNTLPFMNEPFSSVPGYFPWEKLEYFWAPIIADIGDRERYTRSKE